MNVCVNPLHNNPATGTCESCNSGTTWNGTMCNLNCPPDQHNVSNICMCNNAALSVNPITGTCAATVSTCVAPKITNASGACVMPCPAGLGSTWTPDASTKCIGEAVIQSRCVNNALESQRVSGSDPNPSTCGSLQWREVVL